MAGRRPANRRREVVGILLAAVVGVVSFHADRGKAADDLRERSTPRSAPQGTLPQDLGMFWLHASSSRKNSVVFV